jgi:hypothetical protein
MPWSRLWAFPIFFKQQSKGHYTLLTVSCYCSIA